MAAGPRATMDFFAAQAAARRRTAVLVVWLLLAWAGTIALAYLGFALLVAGGVLGVEARALAFRPELLVATAALVTLVTAAGGLFHGVRLAREGGHAVAQMVGGVPVDRATGDAAERRLVNVVEEMAIASGLPVPAIYVLPGEDGINAFAAGFTPDRAVVAVTRGAVEQLSRDELQGVVAHEFSHLLNADARLNLRLVAIVGGITVLALIGRILVRGLDDGPDLHFGRGLRGRGGRARLAVLLAGACLWIAGSIGAFFGKVVRAAVSRQREFLADAAAVQFTRNPEGLAGALARIAERGSALASAGAPEVSHFFFANGLRSTWLSTHPPLEERIERISPRFVARAARAAVAEALAAAGREPAAAEIPMQASALAGLEAAHGLAATVGRPGPRHVGYAAGLLARLPPDVAVAARDPAGAPALVRALLADPAPVVQDLQLRALGDEAVRAEVGRLATALAGASRGDRLAILDLALPALDGSPRDRAAALVRDLTALASADGRTTVFEWAVQRIVRRRLERILGRRGPPARARTLADAEMETLEVLSVLAWLGARDERGAQAALDAGTAALGRSRRWRPLPRERARASTLDAALARLDGAAPALARSILDACAATVLADGRVTAAEAEVIRAIAATLGCPVPPLVEAPPAAAAEAGAGTG